MILILLRRVGGELFELPIPGFPRRRRS